MSFEPVIRARPEFEAFDATRQIAGRNQVWIAVLPHRIETIASVLGLAEGAAVLPLSYDATPKEVAEHAARLGAYGLITDTARAAELDGSAFGVVAVYDTHGQLSVTQRDGHSASDIGAQGLILMTSGSTGTPKYVPLQADNLILSARTIARTLELTAEDTAALALPMFHIGAYVDLYLAPLSAGGDVRVLPPRDIEALRVAARLRQVTWAQMVPTQLAAFLRATSDKDCAEINAALRLIRMVSADLPPDLQREAEAKLPDVAIVQIYGMTETAGQIASGGLHAEARRAGSVGRPDGAEVQVRGPLGAQVATGDVGEVWVRSPARTTGYLLGAELAQDAEGWFQTGDLGRFDADRFLYLVGRDRETINRGGEKVSFQDVERAALAIDGVTEAACFAIPHPSLGQDLGLSFVAGSGGPDEGNIRDHLGQALPLHKLPRQFHQVSALRLLKGGKVDRAALLADWRGAREARDIAPLRAEAAQLAQIWEDVLGVEVTSGHMDFFDAGGDSLSAEIALAMIEEQFGVRLEAGVLYQAPTLEGLAGVVRAAPARQASKALPKAMVQSIRAATSTWSGRRLDPLGLVMVRNETAAGTPLFWLCNADVESTGLSYALADAHPVYVMRTLFRFKKRIGKARDLARLVRYYADQVERIAQGREVLLGGFCDGALLARDMLALLQERSVSVKAFVCADQEFNQALPVPAIFARSTGSVGTAPFTYRAPASGLAEIAPMGHVLQVLDGDHVGVLAYPDVLPFAQMIRAADADGIPAPALTAPEDLAARQAWQTFKLRLKGPRISAPGAAFEMRVTVQNQTGRDLPQTECARLYLWARFKNFDGMQRVQRAAVADLPTTFARGETCEIVMRMQYPDTRLPQLLQIGLVDDGLGWLPGPANRIMFARG